MTNWATTEEYTHLDESLASLEALVRELVLDSDKKPTSIMLDYVRLRQRHIEELLIFRAKAAGRNYTTSYDFTDKQREADKSIKHFMRILDALYGPQPAECPEPRVHEPVNASVLED